MAAYERLTGGGSAVTAAPDPDATRRMRLLVVGLTASGMLLQVGDALSGVAGYILTRGLGEANPLVPTVVAAAGVPSLFWLKVALVLLTTFAIATLPPRLGLVVAVALATAGAVGLVSNLPNVDGTIDVSFWVHVLRTGGRG